MQKVPQLLEWFINLDNPSTSALIRSENNNSASGKKTLVESDLLDLRLRFYRTGGSGRAEQVRLSSPWAIGLNGKAADDLSGDDLFRSESFSESYLDSTIDLLKTVTSVEADGSELTIKGTGFLTNGTPTHVTPSGLVALAEYNGSTYEITNINSTTIVAGAVGTSGSDTSTPKVTTIDRSDYYYADFLDLETSQLAAALVGEDSINALVTIELGNGNPSTRRRTVVRHNALVLGDTYDENASTPGDLIEVVDGGDPSNVGLLSGIDGGTA